MTMTMTHSEKSPHRSNEGLALQARVSGPWPLKKESVLLGKLAHGKECKYKLLWTECNASRLEMNSMYKKKQQRNEIAQAVAALNSQQIY